MNYDKVKLIAHNLKLLAESLEDAIKEDVDAYKPIVSDHYTLKEGMSYRYNGDDDGDPDIYVCNDFGFLYGGNWVLINDGTGQFAQGDALGADLVTACMGASVADMNRDGYLDLYMTSTADQHLLENEKDGYIEITATSGFGHIDIFVLLLFWLFRY